MQRVGLMLCVALGLAACKPEPLTLTASLQTSDRGVDVRVQTNHRCEHYIDALNLSRMDAPRDDRFFVPWDKLQDRGDGSALIVVIARNRDGEVERRELVVRRDDVKGTLKPPKASPRLVRPGEEETVVPIEQPSDDKPVVLAAAKEADGGVKLTGTLGERQRVGIDPLELTLAALPGVTVEHVGKPLIFEGGKAKLVVPKADLLLDTPPGDLIGGNHKPWLKLVLSQKHKDETKELVVYLEPPGNDGAAFSLPLLSVADGQPLAYEGKRQGGVLLYKDSYSTRPFVLGNAPQTRALKAVGVAMLLPAAKSASKTCRYSGGFTERYFRRDAQLVAYDAATGKKLGQTTVAGKVPRSCPFMITTYGSSKTSSLNMSPDDAALKASFQKLAKL